MRKFFIFALLSVAVRGAEVRLGENLNVSYEVTGSGDKTLVFVHGWTCDRSFWRLNAPAVAATRRVLLVDLPGHGASDKPEVRYTTSLFARGVEAAMRAAGVERAVLVGHSMGVPVIRQFYREFPGKVTGLVMVDGSYPRAPLSRAELDARQELYTEANYRATAARLLETVFTSDTSAALRTEIREKMLSTPVHVALSAFREIPDPANAAVQPVNVPVLYVHAMAKQDPDQESFLRQIMPRLRFEYWKGGSHFFMMDQPGRFNRTLLEFLDHQGL